MTAIVLFASIHYKDKDKGTPGMTPNRDNETFWSIDWPHGALTMRAIGGMLAPLQFTLPDGQRISPLYTAPWAEEQGTQALSGLMRGLRGEWPCAPFGPAQTPDGLPPGWASRDGGSPWDHGHSANHAWTLVDRSDGAITLRIELPESDPLAWMERVIRPNPDAPELDIELTMHPRRDAMLPFALHPTFAVPSSGMQLLPGEYAAVHTYPMQPEPGVSRLTPDRTAASLKALPSTGGTADFSKLPLDFETEEILQLQDCRSAFVLRYASGIEVVLDWDRAQLPDAVLWVSQRGRRQAPWNGRNQALGIEPCNSCFDLSRVAQPPERHPLSHRRGLPLTAGRTFSTRYRIRARLA